MTEAEERKQRSIDVLKKNNIPYIDDLPVIETADMISLRTAEEIAKRAAVLLIIAGYACDVLADNNISDSKEFFYQKFKQYGLLDELTPDESNFFNAEYPDPKEASNFTWQYESAYALLWVLGMVNTLYYPDKTCSEGTVAFLLAKNSSFSDFFAKVNMRDVNEILDENDLIYRYHWAVVEARINGSEAPAGLNSDVVYERHKALNWVIGYGLKPGVPLEWDEVTTDT